MGNCEGCQGYGLLHLFIDSWGLKQRLCKPCWDRATGIITSVKTKGKVNLFEDVRNDIKKIFD